MSVADIFLLKKLNHLDKSFIRDWKEFTTKISESTPVDVNETPDQKLARIAMLEADPEQWFKYYFPLYTFAESADFHVDASQRIIDNEEWYEVRMWSRELAKSTRTMMEVFYLTMAGHRVPAAYPSISNDLQVTAENNLSDLPALPEKQSKRTRKKNILLISNSADNAERMLLPYKANLEANNRMINDYGMQKNPGNWESSEFVTLTGISFRALGAGQSPRGSRNEETRPDVIIFDDIDTDEDCRNPEIIKNNWKWIEEAAMSTRSVSRNTTIIFCGNRIASDCCIQRATFYADYVDMKNIRDGDGRSTWPQKNTEEEIDRVLSVLSYAAIQKEYYNNPLYEGSVFKEMPYKPSRPLAEYSLLVCYTDPSYKESKKNDYKATVLIGKWRDEFHVIKAFVEQTGTADMVQWHYDIMDIVGTNACYYFMEQVFLQDMFYKEFNTASRLQGISVPITGDQRPKPDKFVRIETLLQPLVRNGKFYLNENEQQSPHMRRLEEQFINFGTGSRAHDDGPDACEGAVWMINNKQSLSSGGGITTFQRKRNPKKSF
jgi:predicted phage terminase large subunit-like protein